MPAPNGFGLPSQLFCAALNGLKSSSRLFRCKTFFSDLQLNLFATKFFFRIPKSTFLAQNIFFRLPTRLFGRKKNFSAFQVDFFVAKFFFRPSNSTFLPLYFVFRVSSQLFHPKYFVFEPSSQLFCLRWADSAFQVDFFGCAERIHVVKSTFFGHRQTKHREDDAHSVEVIHRRVGCRKIAWG